MFKLTQLILFRVIFHIPHIRCHIFPCTCINQFDSIFAIVCPAQFVLSSSDKPSTCHKLPILPK